MAANAAIHLKHEKAATTARTADDSFSPEIRGIIMDWREAVALPELAEKWDMLACHAAEPNAFAEHWYLLPALNSLAKNDNVRVFLLWDDQPEGRLLRAIMPLCRMSHYAGLPLKNEQNWLNPNAFLGTPLIHKDHVTDFWRHLFSALDENAASAMFLHINALDNHAIVAKSLEQICNEQSRKFAMVHMESRAFLERGLSPDQYYQNHVRSKKRKELRRQHKRLAELGALSFARSNGQGDLDAWANDFLALERRGWKGKEGSALDCDDSNREFFRTILRGAAAAGKLELLSLNLNDKPIAMLATFITPPGAFSFKTAFDEDYARFSPGVMLQIENLKLLERSDIAWCDSCAAADHPMIDSIWHGRRDIGRYSVAIGGSFKRSIFSFLLTAELAKAKWKGRNQKGGLDDADF